MKEPPPRQRRPVFVGGTGGILQNPVFVIIIINLVIYVASFFSQTGMYPIGQYLVSIDKLSYYFGLIPGIFTSHPWTIVTAMFLHGGIWHILGNMITLFFFGNFLYRLVGAKWFLLLYFVAGIAGNGLYLLLGDPISIAIGASGAIYGIAGALVVMMPTLRVALLGILPMPLWVFVIIFMGIWSIPGVIPNIGWQAHLGGFVIGIIAGFFFRFSRRFVLYV